MTEKLREQIAVLEQYVNCEAQRPSGAAPSRFFFDAIATIRRLVELGEGIAAALDEAIVDMRFPDIRHVSHPDFYAMWEQDIAKFNEALAEWKQEMEP